MFKVESRWHHQDKVKIEWNLGKRCNYDCSYCPSEIHDNSSPHTDYFILQDAVDKLAEIGKPIRLSFTGGEPTVHPDFERLIEYIHKKPHISFVSVTTNGTRKASFYRNLPVSQYVFSLHFEYDYRQILDKIISLCASDDPKHVIRKDVLVHVMAHHKYMKEVRDTVNRLHFYQIPYAIRRVRWTEGDHDIFDDLRYDQNDLDYIKSQNATVMPNTIIHYHRDKDGNYTKEYHANDIIKLHLNQYKGWECNAGLESLMINWDGEVHRATCRVGGSLGNIYNGTFNIPNKPIVCDRNYCTCAADIPLTKYDKNDSNKTQES